MLAVIEVCGKQYHVKTGDVIKIESKYSNVGEIVKINNIIALYSPHQGDLVKLGDPFIIGSSVKAEVLKQGRDKKILVFKKKRRHNYRRKKGHRQDITILKITDIGDK